MSSWLCLRLPVQLRSGKYFVSENISGYNYVFVCLCVYNNPDSWINNNYNVLAQTYVLLKQNHIYQQIDEDFCLCFPRYIHAGQSLNSSITTFGCSEEPLQHVDYLEHVVVKVLISHPRRGDLEINLVSPSGTRSQLLAKR